MNSQALPENILRRIDPKDRQPLGKHGRIAPEREAALAVTMEKATHGLFMQYLRLNDIFFIHSNFAKASRSTPGTPDFCFCVNGQAMAVEFKTPTGRLSKDQERAIERMRSNGWAIEICTSLTEAIGFIQRFKK
jgi:hypothetical protein